MRLFKSDAVPFPASAWALPASAAEPSAAIAAAGRASTNSDASSRTRLMSSTTTAAGRGFQELLSFEVYLSVHGTAAMEAVHAVDCGRWLRAARARFAGAAVGPHLRPVRVADLGTRPRAPRTRHDRWRHVLEAVAGHCGRRVDAAGRRGGG